MTKEFYALSLMQQVEFINKKLKQNKNISLKNICKNYNLSKTKLNNSFYRLGYIYDKQMHAYVKNNNSASLNNTEKIIQTNSKSIDIKNKNIKDISCNEKEQLIKEFNEIKKSLNDVQALLVLKEDLIKIIENYNKNENVIYIETPELKIDPNDFRGELKNRLIKVHENINKDWMKFCKKNKQYKMQDLYSLALKEFMEKYKCKNI